MIKTYKKVEILNEETQEMEIFIEETRIRLKPIADFDRDKANAEQAIVDAQAKIDNADAMINLKVE